MKAPHEFQSGFVAQRVARGLPGDVKVVQFKRGKGIVHLIEKTDDGVKTYWVSPADGWVAIKEAPQ